MADPDPDVIAAASAFDSYKGIPEKSGSVTVSGTISSTPGSNFSSWTESFDVGRSNTSFQVYMTTTAQGGRRYSLEGGYIATRTGTIPGPTSVPYNVAFAFNRNGSALTCEAHVFNPYGSTLTLDTETITFYLVPFVGEFK